MKQLLSSWKTTGGAALAAGAYVFDKCIYREVAGVPAWCSTVATVAFIVGIALIGIFARDHDKTSEEAGAHESAERRKRKRTRRTCSYDGWVLWVSLGLMLVAAGPARGQTNRTPILRGVLQSDLDGGGKAITNIYMRGGGTRRLEPWWESGDALEKQGLLKYNFGTTNTGTLANYLDKGPCAGKGFYWGDEKLSYWSTRVGGILAGITCPRMTWAFLDQEGEEFITAALQTNALEIHFGYDAVIDNIVSWNGTNYNLTYGHVLGTNTLAGTNVVLAGAVFLPDPITSGNRLKTFEALDSDGDRNLKIAGSDYDGVVIDRALAVNNQLTAATLSLGGGQAISKIASTSVATTIDFGNTSAQSSTDSTGITVTGAAVGDPVFVGGPAAPNANTCFTAYVSATDTVKVRFNNYSSGAVDPASATFRVTVFHY